MLGTLLQQIKQPIRLAHVVMAALLIVGMTVVAVSNPAWVHPFLIGMLFASALSFISNWINVRRLRNQLRRKHFSN